MNMLVDDLGAGHSTLTALLKPPAGTLPLDEGEGIARYLYEQYVDTTGGWKRKLYYALKPVIPRPIQIALRRRYVAVQAAATFPAWPVESVIVDAADAALRKRLAVEPVLHRIGFWPKGFRFAFVITHDVEWDAGLRRAPDLAAVERSLGFISSWNLVPERYPIDWSIVERLRNEGNEIGIHGLKHDGKLFQSRGTFDRRMKKIDEYARTWGAQGFRSPSTLRNASWMAAMRFAYDSSFPDTDPYEPQPGGCCTIWPYFLGSMVELPMTMPQDHTLFEILKHTDIDTWKKKAEWIAHHGGIVVVNVHPDYMLTDDRLRHFEELLRFMKTLQGMWHVLPREAAEWWRARHATELRVEEGVPVMSGPAAGRASIVRTEIREGKRSDVEQHIQ
jgi:hypothetical protein